MKKILALVLALIMVLSLVACGGKTAEPAPAAKENAPAKVTKRIISDMDTVFYPDKFVVPFIDIIHEDIVSNK